MTPLVWSLALLPAAAGLAGLLVPLPRRRTAAMLATGATSAACAAALSLYLWGGELDSRGRRIDFGDIAVGLDVHLDPTVAVVAVAVTVVALLVQLYSVAYLRGDDRYAPYAAQISLFTAAMLLVVIADDLVLLLIGWEVMGACSYLLIGHDRRLPEAPAAAVKAFLVTRVGDVGFLLGVVMLGVHTGTFSIARIVETPPGDGVVLAAGLLLLAGAVGKSAQFPLHTWLPDAMAGPTPVSALIHAATMVAAGAYLLYRLAPLYLATATSTVVIAVIAAITMLMAALAALAADDLKRVLAWSTVSQVAFMFAGIAVAAPDAAVAHLLSHAAFKALLFLCAGVVIGMVATNAMSGMGGLRHGAPVTFWTMTIGFAALAGVPPLSGFISKEAVLGAAAESGGIAGTIVWWSGLATAALTAAYATRAWLRVFFGTPRGRAGRHDPEPLLRLPLLILAVPAAGLGLAGFGGTLNDLPQVHFGPALAVLACTAAGAVTAWLLWRSDTAADPARWLGEAGAVFAGGFGGDRVQDALVVRPVRALARLARHGDVRLVDGAVEGSGRLTVGLARVAVAAHRFGLPRHLLAALGGAVVIAAIGVLAYWGGAA